MSGLTRGLRWGVWSMTAAYALLAFVLTHLPPSELPKTRVSDKLAHFVAYFILTSLLYISLWVARRALVWTIVLTMLIALVYGAFDELTQPLVGRFCSLHDWLADAAGAASATIVMTLVSLPWRLRKIA